MAEFDLDIAREMADSFSASGGVCCRILSHRGEVLYRTDGTVNECDYLRSLPGQAPVCHDLHFRSLAQAQRFGGRYIYSCASGLTYFSAPILCDGSLAGGLVAGPVLMSEADDYLDDTIKKRCVPAGDVRSLLSFFLSLPQVDPAKLRHLSTQLFANAVYISDNSRELLRSRDSEAQQRSIGEYIRQVKASAQPLDYPIDLESQLFYAISKGDKPTAARLLNDLLGHIFFFSADSSTVQSRIAELLVILSRAAIHGGAPAQTILDITDHYGQELKDLRSQEEVAAWLAKVLGRFTDLVFDLVDSKHKNVIRKAMSYISANCGRDLTLNEVANHVGYSHSHFSKVFKEEMGCGFRTYLNQVRMEKSKGLLLSGNLSIAEISQLCGFEDQSYHCKVFKKLVGVTPDKYRKQSRRIDTDREYARTK